MLPFGGASGSGYLSQAEVKAGMEELKSEGEFKDGVFRRRTDVEGKRNLDGYQAIWEHVNDRPMAYPKPRYPQPIFMDPATYAWVPVEGAAGRYREAAWRVHRAAQRMSMRIEAGASYTARGKGIYLVVRGAGLSRGADNTLISPPSHLDAGETVVFSARQADRTLALRSAQSRGRAGAGIRRGSAEAAE